MSNIVERCKVWIEAHSKEIAFFMAIVFACSVQVSKLQARVRRERKLTQTIEELEQKLEMTEQDLEETKKDLSQKTQENVVLREDVFVYEKLIEQYAKEIEELRELKEKMDKEKLERMREDPWTPTLDFLPYLPGDFEENVRLMATVMYKEAGNGSDEEQQLQGLVLLGRVFDPYAYPDEIGDLRKVVFAKNQYPWAAKGIDGIVPTEQCIKNARAVLTGDVLDTPNIKGMTRNVKFANTTPLGYETYCKVWNESSQVWVYFDYGS